MLILGRQPTLGLAELESLYGADKVERVGEGVAIVDIDPCLLAFDRLGGSVKFCKILTVVDTISWPQIEKYLLQVSPSHSQQMPEGKMQLGLSAINLDVNIKQLEVTGLKLKKAIRKTGRPVRLVPNKTTELNSAQVLHNRLTGQNGWELVLIKQESQTIIAQTVKIQDIESYTLRDRGRPKRDTRVGMLPPKLAQIIINLAAGKLPEEKLESICEIPLGESLPRPDMGQSLLDPFCGTGVVLQEAVLMGYKVYGTDLEQRMVDYSTSNLDWLKAKFSLPELQDHLEKGDATSHQWQPPINLVATETYLGRPFTHIPSPEILAQTISDCNLIIKKFLKNIGGQIDSDTRLCLAVPAWQTKPNEFKHLPLIDQIKDLGYNRISFEHVRDKDLIYYRPDQIVARELLVLSKN